ncbi:hypothetical protein SAMD00019534_126330, partial [Acytostelium subglobosum LB1]
TQEMINSFTTSFIKPSTMMLVRRSTVPLSNFNRSFSTVQSVATSSSSTTTVATTENNGLKQFFEHEYKKGTYPLSGNSWEARDLRGKSFEDLHKLWFVLLKERNKVATERELAKGHKLTNPLRLKKIRKSMAAIKVVLGERDQLRKQLYILTQCQDNERKEVLANIERLKTLVGAVSLTPGLKDLEKLQDSFKVDESLSIEESIDNLVVGNNTNK